MVAIWWSATVILIVGRLLVVGAALLGQERVVFQTEFGDIQMALYPQVAPKTTTHIMKLAKLGGYNTNHFFRVDKGFVAQTAAVVGGRTQGLNMQQQEEADRTVPLEVRSDVKHDRRGLLSMARYNDPNSGSSSFSITLGPAPHLDMQYAIFGEVTDGLATLAKFEELPTRKEGIFVLPTQRITIHSTYVYTPGISMNENRAHACEAELANLEQRFDAVSKDLHAARLRQLP